MPILILALIGVVIYFVWRSGGGSHPGGFDQRKDLSSVSDEALEAELARRQSQQSLEAEVADLKRQLEALKKDGVDKP